MNWSHIATCRATCCRSDSVEDHDRWKAEVVRAGLRDEQVTPPDATVLKKQANDTYTYELQPPSLLIVIKYMCLKPWMICGPGWHLAPRRSDAVTARRDRTLSVADVINAKLRRFPAVHSSVKLARTSSHYSHQTPLLRTSIAEQQCGRRPTSGITSIREADSHRSDSPGHAFPMAENIPPTSAATAPADQPGRPYYESLRTSLTQTLAKKRALDDQLSALEDQIYKAETSYLEETANSGNIVRGFDGWAKGVQIGGGRGDDRRRGRVREDERVFSRSSVGFMRVRVLTE